MTSRNLYKLEKSRLGVMKITYTATSDWSTRSCVYSSQISAKSTELYCIIAHKIKPHFPALFMVIACDPSSAAKVNFLGASEWAELALCQSRINYVDEH